jgi:hypothetical protein
LNENLVEALRLIGRDGGIPEKYKAHMINVGFQNVVEIPYKWPQNDGQGANITRLWDSGIWSTRWTASMNFRLGCALRFWVCRQRSWRFCWSGPGRIFRTRGSTRIGPCKSQMVVNVVPYVLTQVIDMSCMDRSLLMRKPQLLQKRLLGSHDRVMPTGCSVPCLDVSLMTLTYDIWNCRFHILAS